MRFSHFSHTQSGFTLLELLVTLLLLGILLAIALPDFNDLVQQKRGDSNVRTLMTTLELARTSAIVDNSLVTLCRSDNGEECRGQWEDGILIFVDHDGDRRLDLQDRIISYTTFPNFDGQLFWRAFQNRQYLQITPQGFTRYQNGNFTFCPASGNLQHARQLILNRTGRVRQAIDRNGDGIREDSRGRPIRC